MYKGIYHTLYFKFLGILIEAYAPLGSPGRYHVNSTDPVVMEDSVIKEIAAQKGVTVAQVGYDNVIFLTVQMFAEVFYFCCNNFSWEIFCLIFSSIYSN